MEVGRIYKSGVQVEMKNLASIPANNASTDTHVAHEQSDDGDAKPGMEGPEVALARALVVQEDGAEADAMWVVC